jgi:hypothetical protein
LDTNKRVELEAFITFEKDESLERQKFEEELLRRLKSHDKEDDA